MVFCGNVPVRSHPTIPSQKLFPHKSAPPYHAFFLAPTLSFSSCCPLILLYIFSRKRSRLFWCAFPLDCNGSSMYPSELSGRILLATHHCINHFSRLLTRLDVGRPMCVCGPSRRERFLGPDREAEGLRRQDGNQLWKAGVQVSMRAEVWSYLTLDGYGLRLRSESMLRSVVEEIGCGVARQIRPDRPTLAKRSPLPLPTQYEAPKRLAVKAASPLEALLDPRLNT